MVHLVEMVSDPGTYSYNNKSIYTPIGAGLMIDFNPDNFQFTFIALIVLATIFLAVLLKVFKIIFTLNSIIDISGEVSEVADFLCP